MDILEDKIKEYKNRFDDVSFYQISKIFGLPIIQVLNILVKNNLKYLVFPDKFYIFDEYNNLVYKEMTNYGWYHFKRNIKGRIIQIDSSYLITPSESQTLLSYEREAKSILKSLKRLNMLNDNEYGLIYEYKRKNKNDYFH